MLKRLTTQKQWVLISTFLTEKRTALGKKRCSCLMVLSLENQFSTKPEQVVCCSCSTQKMLQIYWYWRKCKCAVNGNRMTQDYFTRFRRLWQLELSDYKTLSHNALPVPDLMLIFKILYQYVKEIPSIDVKTQKILTSSEKFYRKRYQQAVP